MTYAKRFSRTFPVLLAAASLGAADIASAGPFSICAERNEAANEMVMKFGNGCVSSSIRYLGQDIKVEIDENRAWIRVSGGFNYEKLSTGQIVTADCAGGKRLEVKLPYTGARLYSVSHNGNRAGTIDLTTSTGPVCTTPASAGTIGEMSLRTEWKSTDPAKFVAKPAASLTDAVSPIYSGHPETSEGAPTLKLEVAPWPGQPAMQVRITMMGYLDDSVSGEQFVARVEEDEGGWVLKKVWSRNMCARGAHAGQWTSNLCP